MAKNKSKPMTVAEAGRKGGKARAAKHSSEQLREWARLGGRPRKQSSRDDKEEKNE